MKLLIVAGARPNFMKIAPLMQEISKVNQESPGEGRIDCRLIHTGQHYDAKMSEVFFRELGIPAPDINLEVGSGSHAEQTARIMTAFEPVCLREKPDWVVVVGDVNSTMACTLVASKLGVKDGPRGSRPPQLRPHHAGGNQPSGDRRPGGPAADPFGRRG